MLLNIDMRAFHQKVSYRVRVLCVIFILALCVFLVKNVLFKSEVDYTWPETACLSEEMKYQGNGEITYTYSRQGYADGTGVYSDFYQWQIYIDHAQISDIENYINQLKAVGFCYKALDAMDKPPVEYDWTGVFEWRGTSENVSVIIQSQKESTEATVPGNEEKIICNLVITFLDGVAWTDH